MCMFCRSLFGLLYFFLFCPCCFLFFDIWILISPLVSSRILISTLVSSRIIICPLVSSRILISPLVSSRIRISTLVSSRILISTLVSSRILICPLVSSRILICPLVSSRILISPLVSSNSSYDIVVFVCFSIYYFCPFKCRRRVEQIKVIYFMTNDFREIY